VFRDFDRAHPRILGGLLDAVATGLRDLPEVRLANLPRMADFARWVVACSPGLGLTAEVFLKAYAENREVANAVALEASPVAAAMIKLADAGRFEGKMQDLLGRLEVGQTPETLKHSTWPKSARALRGALQRLAANLRVAGVAVMFLPRTSNVRPIRVEKIATANGAGRKDGAGDRAGDGGEQGDEQQSLPPSRPTPCPDRGRDGDDGGDGLAPTFSAQVEDAHA